MQKPWAEIFDIAYITEMAFSLIIFKSTNHLLDMSTSLRLLVKDEVENECKILLWDSFALLSNEITYKTAIEYCNTSLYHEMLGTIIDEVIRKLTIESKKVENEIKLRSLIFLVGKLNKDPLADIKNVYAEIDGFKEVIRQQEEKLNKQLLLDTDNFQVTQLIISGLEISILACDNCQSYEREIASATQKLSSTHLEEAEKLINHHQKSCLDLKRRLDNMYQSAYAVLGEKLVISGNRYPYCQNIESKNKVQKN